MENKKILIIGGGVIALGALVLLATKAKANKIKKFKKQQEEQQNQQQNQQPPQEQIGVLAPLPDFKTKQELLDFYYVELMLKSKDLEYEDWINWETRIKDLPIDDIKLSYNCVSSLISDDENRLPNQQYAKNSTDFSKTNPMLFKQCMDWVKRTGISLFS